ncbi:hypothetical protein B0H14DRAFT_3159162 [Mycena olivaceomarginata]|nr:hypothetical protein B0H14DRAFT_3159162 [Mycena olivaceomarginata]
MVATMGNAILWKYRRIPFEFESGYPHESDVRDAMTKWEKAAGVSFVEHRNEANYIVIQDPASGKSSSSIGMLGGKQTVEIEVGYKALHELGHVLGLTHEQRRSNRDTYVDMQWDNIDRGTSNGDFSLDSNSDNLTDYDPASVMHYPAPATGWGGTPDDQEVWTMRWKDDQNKQLGPQKWSELSDLDKSDKGLRAKYEKVPVPMGAETANGSWNYPYAVQFPFSIGDRQFFYGQNLSEKNWFIQELKSGGKMGDETDHGTWGNAYGVQFPFTIGDRELKSGGKMGDETDHGTWGNAYGVQFPFTIGDRVFFYGQNLSTNYWFIQELKSGGKMGDETDNGTWSYAYGVQFPFTIGGRVFFYGQNLSGKNWFIQELKSGGKMGDETDHGDWGNAYQVQFPYSIGSNQYFYGQNLSMNYWFIQKFEAGGKMGDELQGGFWNEPYSAQIPFAIGGSQYFYGQKLSGAYNLFIQQLIDVS